MHEANDMWFHWSCITWLNGNKDSLIFEEMFEPRKLYPQTHKLKYI